MPGECSVDALTYQNLAILGFSAETSGDIAHRADRGIARAVSKTDLDERRIALRDARTKTKLAAALTPDGDQCTCGFPHRHGHLDRAFGRVGTRHRIVEEYHDPVAGKLVERALELAYERPQ